MHHLMLVTYSVLKGSTSDTSRRTAHAVLQADDSFCGEGGRFGAPLCDWFVIGGRWSGILSETRFGPPYKAALKREFPDFAKGSFPSALVQKHLVGLDQLWHRFGGTGPNPLTRSGYDDFGADDDAMIVDQLLYDRFLQPHAGCEKNIGGDGVPDFVDLDDEAIDESFIGSKWLIVVDYHN